MLNARPAPLKGASKAYASVAQTLAAAALDKEAADTTLLYDLRTLYGASDEHVPTARIIEDLTALQGACAARDPNELARRLARFGLKPASIRVGDTVVRGYRTGDLAATFARYLFEEGGATSSGKVAAA